MAWLLKDKSAAFKEVTLLSDRLRLRAARLSDYPQWAQVRGRNRDYLKPYEPAWPEQSLEKDFFQRRVQRLNHDWNADRSYAFLIFEHTQDRLIGGININNVTRGAAQCATLGYWLDEAQQGQGYMTEAARLALDFAFYGAGLARMNAATLVHNVKSQAMLKRLGFDEEGFAKAYIQIDGLRQDHVLFGLNIDDFLRPA